MKVKTSADASTTNTAPACPGCHQPLPARAPAGLCPACLLAQGNTATKSAGDAPARFTPPSLEEVVRLFPHLEVSRLLGAGGMGAVYLARQPALDRWVAIKVLPTSTNGGPNASERFNREARALARLQHPNIVAVHEFGQAGDWYYFLMEYVDGVNLRQLQQSGRLSAREALQLIPQICDALQYAHDEGVVHRDIKPENVLIDRKGRVKIADFGLAKFRECGADTERLTLEGQVMGTPHYMAPEQVARPLSVDHRADIYSLGVVFYEMLTGELPIGKFAPPSRKVEVDVRLDAIVLRALENDPARRYQRASEVKDRVETVSHSPGQPSAPQSRSDSTDSDPSTDSVHEPRSLYWGPFPVVVERQGEREVSFNGVLGAVALTMGLSAIAHMIVRWIAGTEHAMPRTSFIAGILVIVWGIRRTLNRTEPEPPAVTEAGTVILDNSHRRRVVLESLVFVGLFAWIIGSHFLKVHAINPWLAASAGKANARQVALPDATGRFLTATLPQGGTLDLLAVSEPGLAPNQWWQPDGQPLTNRYEVHNLSSPGVAVRRQNRMILRIADLPSGSDGPFFDATPGSSVGSGGTVYTEGHPLPNSRPVAFAWESTPKTASFNIGIAVDPWRTVASVHPASRRITHSPAPGDPRWDLQVHGIADSPDGTQVTVVMKREPRNWRFRLVAVDANGNEVTDRATTGSTTSTGDDAILTFTFQGMALAQITAFKAQVRPIHWVRFNKVALRPDGPLPAPEPLRFAPEITITFDELIDFDSARVASLPADEPPGRIGGASEIPIKRAYVPVRAPVSNGIDFTLGPSDPIVGYEVTDSYANPNSSRSVADEPSLAGAGRAAAWATLNGFDALVGAQGLEIIGTEFADVRADDWDRLAPQQVIDRVYQARFAPRILPAPGASAAYRTFAYQTRDGGFGLLHLHQVGPGLPAATIRLKRIER